MNDERFRNIASGIQSLILALAVVVGGGWALFRFASLEEIERATAELEQLKRGLRQRGVLKIQLTPERLPTLATGEPLLSVHVSVENAGNRTEVLRWDRSKLFAAQLLARNGRIGFGPQVPGRYVIAGTDTQTSSILPGQSRTFPFLVILPASGLYQLVFEALVSPSELEVQLPEHRLAGAEVEEIVWRESKYYAVK